MNCQEVEDMLLSQDNGALLPPEAASHLGDCPNCARLAERLSRADAELRLVKEPDSDLVESVMTEIERSDLHPRGKQSLLGWIFGGVLLMAALVALPQSNSFRFLVESVLGARVDLSISMVIGIGLVAYLGVFVVAHSDRLEGVVQELVSRPGR